MADPGLGLFLNGGMLQRVPSEASPGEQTAAINGVIDKLNGWNGVIVKQGTVSVPVSASGQSVTTIPHYLKYAPVPYAFLNNVGLTATGSTSLNIPLPTWLSADTAMTDASSGKHFVGFQIYMQCMTDATNLYIYTLNSTGVAVTGLFPVTYYLMRITADK